MPSAVPCAWPPRHGRAATPPSRWGAGSSDRSTACVTRSRPSAFGFALIRADLRMRRVCDGMAVLDAAVNRPAELTQLGVRPAQPLMALATAVDALADLHVAEAALGVVGRRRLGGDSRGGRPGPPPTSTSSGRLGPAGS